MIDVKARLKRDVFNVVSIIGWVLIAVYLFSALLLGLKPDSGFLITLQFALAFTFAVEGYDAIANRDKKAFGYMMILIAAIYAFTGLTNII